MPALAVGMRRELHKALGLGPLFLFETMVPLSDSQIIKLIQPHVMPYRGIENVVDIHDDFLPIVTIAKLFSISF